MNSKSAPSARQVLSHAIDGLETLRLMLEETEALANCACNGLDSLPSSLRARSDFSASSNAPPSAPSSTSSGARLAATDAAAGAGIRGVPSVAEIADAAAGDVNTIVITTADAGDSGDGVGSDVRNASGDVPTPWEIIMTGLDDLHEGLDDADLEADPDVEDQRLAVGRVQTLVMAECKAMRRSYLYCLRLRAHLHRLLAALSPSTPSTPSGAPPAATAASSGSSSTLQTRLMPYGPGMP